MFLGGTFTVESRKEEMWVDPVTGLIEQVPSPSPVPPLLLLLLLFLLLLMILLLPFHPRVLMSLCHWHNVMSKLIWKLDLYKRFKYYLQDWIWSCSWQKFLSYYLQLSCQEKMIISIIDSGFNTTGWYDISFSQIIQFKKGNQLSLLVTVFVSKSLLITYPGGRLQDARWLQR